MSDVTKFSQVPFPDFDGTQNCAGKDVEDFYRPTYDKSPTKAEIDKDYRKELKAMQVCQGCAFWFPCQEWGIANEEFGVWGGTSEQQRRSIRKANGVEIRPIRVRQDAWYTRVTQAGHKRAGI